MARRRGTGGVAGAVGGNNANSSVTDDGAASRKQTEGPIPNGAAKGVMVPALAVAAVAFVLYTNTLDGGFVYDDARGVVANPDVIGGGSYSNMLSNDFWGVPMDLSKSHKSYRPLTVLTFRLNHDASPPPSPEEPIDPFGFHLVNVSLHAVVSALVVVLCATLGYARSTSTVAGLLFAVHSIHTEAVANIVGRAEVLCALFFLATILLYCKQVSFEGRGQSGLVWRVGVAMCTLAAMLAKEQGLMVVGVCAALDIVVFCGMTPMEALRAIATGSTKATSTRPVAAGLRSRIGFLAAVGAVLLGGRVYMMQGASPTFNPLELPAAFHPSALVRTLTLNYYIVFNVQLLVLPYHLCNDWAFGSIPLVKAVSDPRVALILLLYVALAFSVWTLFFKKSKLPQTQGADKPTFLSLRTELAIAVIFLVIPFIPASNLLFRVGFVVAERILYLPSLGYCLMLASLLNRLSKHSKMSARAIGLVVLALLAWRTWTRNNEWHSDFSIHEAAVRDNPANIKVVTNFGLLQHNRARDMDLPQGQRDAWAKKAEGTYLKALAMNKHYSAAGFDLGNLYYEQGRLDEAVKVFRQALEKSDFTKTPMKILTNLATIMYKTNKLDEAEAYFKASIEIDPGHLPAINGLGSLYGSQKRFEESSAMFRQALQLHPGYVEGHFNYGTLLYTMGQLDEAEKEFKLTLKLKPGHPGATNNLKVIDYARQHGKT